MLVFEWCRAPVSLVFRSDMGVNLKQPMMVRRIFFVLALVNPNLFWNGCQDGRSIVVGAPDHGFENEYKVVANYDIQRNVYLITSMIVAPLSLA